MATDREKLRRHGVCTLAAAASLVVSLALAPALAAETWRGLTAAPEQRCSPCHTKLDYPYPHSVDEQIVGELGAL